jgi:molybdopterin-binding protein
MEQSIRNEIAGIVKEITSDQVLSEIILETAVGEIAAVITTRLCEVWVSSWAITPRP